MSLIHTIASAYTRIEEALARRLIRVVIACRLFNPWFSSAEGRAFVCDLLMRLRKEKGYSRATRAALRRYYVTQPMTVIPVKRYRFKMRYGFWPPGFIAISPTRRCNLSCSGCFSGEKDTDDMSFETADSLVRQARAMGIYMYVLIGGEPLCWPHFFSLVETHSMCSFGVYTNGTCVTEEVAERLARCGNVILDFSVEGDEHMTDARRGEGVFARVKESMALCRAYGLHFGYSVTVTRDNNDYVVSDAFIRMMKEEGCFVGWYYQYMPVGDAPDVSKIPTTAQRAYRRERFAEIRKDNAITVFDFVNDGPLVGGCICAGRQYFHVTAAGDVEPCAFYPFAVDSVHKTSLVDILRSPFFAHVRAYQAQTPDPLYPCPVIDHPSYLRAAVEECKARGTQSTSTLLTGDLAASLDACATATGSHAHHDAKAETRATCS